MTRKLLYNGDLMNVSSPWTEEEISQQIFPDYDSLLAQLSATMLQLHKTLYYKYFFKQNKFSSGILVSGENEHKVDHETHV